MVLKPLNRQYSRNGGRSETRCFLCHWRVRLLTRMTLYVMLMACQWKLAKTRLKACMKQVSIRSWKASFNLLGNDYLTWTSMWQQICILICLPCLTILRCYISFVGITSADDDLPMDPLQTPVRLEWKWKKTFKKNAMLNVFCNLSLSVMNSSATRRSYRKPNSCINNNITYYVYSEVFWLNHVRGLN